MLTIEEIRKKKAEYGYTNEQLSRLSGVPLGTLQKIMGNETKTPRYETLKALSSVFEKPDPENLADYVIADPGMVKEEPAPYGFKHRPIARNQHVYDRQGFYTLEDYLALPDEQRVELIDGYFFDMGAPTAEHQSICGFLYAELFNYIRRNKGGCMPFIAPTDVQLDCDNRTVLQPDVFVVCDPKRITHARIFGQPDLVIEVLSPSTKGKDMFIKNIKYRDAGVREYWMVDSRNRQVIVYLFGKDENDFELKTYSFADTVPVHIYNGDLQIDFKEVTDYLLLLDNSG